MKRLIPEAVRTSEMLSNRVFALGVETWVQHHEAHFHWGSTDLGTERYVVLHLGRVDLVWNWDIS